MKNRNQIIGIFIKSFILVMPSAGYCGPFDGLGPYDGIGFTILILSLFIVPTIVIYGISRIVYGLIQKQNLERISAQIGIHLLKATASVYSLLFLILWCMAFWDDYPRRTAVSELEDICVEYKLQDCQINDADYYFDNSPNHQQVVFSCSSLDPELLEKVRKLPHIKIAN